MPTYFFSDLTSDINTMIHGTITAADYLRLINKGVRDTLNDVDLRSTKRRARLSPNLYEKQYDYACPSDIKGQSIIDVRKQVERIAEFELTTEEEFDREKENRKNLLAITDDDLARLLRISANIDSDALTIHTCETATANGTWAVGADATNLTTDSEDYLQGASSLNFDTNTGATTAYLENSTLTAIDLTDYNAQEVFVWVYIPATSGLTNFILRWGSDSSNYWSQTITTNNEGLAFYTGWNLLRFNWQGATETGTPVITAMDYLRLTITKTAGMAAATDWRMDFIVARKGKIHDIIYYSKYLWQTSSGTYLENSTSTTDYLNVDTEEYNIILNKCAELCARRLENAQDIMMFKKDYQDSVNAYIRRYPSEAKLLTSVRYYLNSLNYDV